MNHFNESELARLMHQSGCFDAATMDSNNCSKLQKIIFNGTADHPFNNARNQKPDWSSIEQDILHGLSYFFYFLAILLNSTLLLLLYKDPLKRFRNSSSFLVFNLALADLTGSSLSLVLEKYNPGEHSSPLNRDILPWLAVATSQCSFLTVMFVSCDRYLAVAQPFRYRTTVLPRRTIFGIVLTWLFSVTLSSLLFFVPQIADRSIGSEIYAINTFILTVLILPLCPLTHASFKRQRRQLAALNSTNRQLRQEKIDAETNLANTAFLVSLSLLLFTSPYLVAFLFSVTKCISCIVNKHFLNFWTCYRAFFALHFGINPIIYAWRLPTYRKSLRRLFTAICTTSAATKRARSAQTTGAATAHYSRNR